MAKHELSAQHAKALELHNKILVSAQLAQNSLWELCAGLKEMRDGKLYKELGYQNFEDYCRTEFSMSRRNAYYYISLVENMSEQNVKTFSHFGASKLYLLSTLSEAEQTEITAENDVESMTVKELEREIKNLRMENDKKNRHIGDLNHHLDEAITDANKYRSGLHMAEAQNQELREQIEELEARPIEVAVAEPSAEMRRMEETIKNLQRVTDEELDRVQEEHLALERQLRQEHAAELEAQKKAYEQKVKELEQKHSGETFDKEAAFFDVYLGNARDALYHLLGSASRSANIFGCTTKIKSLLSEFEKLNDELTTYGRD